MKRRFYINPLLLAPVNLALLIILGIMLRSPRAPALRVTEISIGCALFAIAIVIGILVRRVQKQAHYMPEKVDQLVTTGIYSKCRHPIYLVFILINIATFFLFGSLWLLIPIPFFIFMWYFEAKHEEGVLLEKFGDEYEEYKKKVGVFWPKIAKRGD